MSVRKTIQSVGAGQPLKTGQPLKIETVNVALPKPGEVRFVIVNLNYEAKSRSESNWCHSDLWVCKRDDKGLVTPFPAILGHEGTGVVERVGEGVQLEIGDHAMPGPILCKMPDV